MPTNKGDKYQQNFAEWAPFPAERVVFAGISNADTYIAISGDNLEDNVQSGKRQGFWVVMIRLGDTDEKDGKTEPPYIVAQLEAELLVVDLTAGKDRLVWGARRRLIGGFSSFDAWDLCPSLFVWICASDRRQKRSLSP